MPPLRTIFFDVGNTLLFPDRTHILAPLRQRKLTPSLEQWHTIERKTKKEFDEILQHDGKADHGFWYLFYSHLLQELGVNDTALRDEMVKATRISANWCDIRPGTREILQRLGTTLPACSNLECRWQDCRRTEPLRDRRLFPSHHRFGLGRMRKAASCHFRRGSAWHGSGRRAKFVRRRCLLCRLSGCNPRGNAGNFVRRIRGVSESGLPRVESLEELEGKL